MNLIELYEQYLEVSYDKKIVLFGSGARAVRALDQYLINEEISYVCDNDKNKWGLKLNGYPVFPPEKLLEDVNNTVVIITSMHYIDIYEQLKKMGIQYVYPHTILRYKILHSFYSFIDSYKTITPDIIKWNYNEGIAYKKNISLLMQYDNEIKEVRAGLSDEKSILIFDSYLKKMRYNYKDYTDIVEIFEKQYFVKNLFQYTDNEVFLDVGCYDGQTSIDFVKTVGEKAKKIIAIEPDSRSYQRSLKTLSSSSYTTGKFELYPFGLSNENKKARFNELGDIRSQISIEGATEIEVRRLDDIVTEKITFIKMDIEGEELNALKGAQKTIQTLKPKLAISIYHKFEDLWEIPLYIKKLVPEYKFYIRHHAISQDEKVLYATV